MTDISSKYPFLHSHIAKEMHIDEVLDEIERHQTEVLQGGNTTLATLEILRGSNNIKIPFTPGRNKNISYLLELLLKNYPKEIRTVFSFEFHYDDENKKLNIIEHMEFTLLINLDEYNKIVRSRDEATIVSFLNLMKRFRLFNLTKLIARANNKKELTRIIKQPLGKEIFSYKNYIADKSNPELHEDLCFHKDNFESIQSLVKIDMLQAIIAEHEEPLKRRLKRFGILTPSISDYRDSKLDYILNILSDELANSLTPTELAEVKNAKSLRECLNKVATVVDPVTLRSNDITAHIIEERIIRESELISVVEGLDSTIMDSWLNNMMDKNSFYSATDATGTRYYVHNSQFLPLLEEHYTLLFIKKEDMAGLDGNSKQRIKNNLEFLYATGKSLLDGTINSSYILNTDNKKTELRDLISKIDSEYSHQSSSAAVKEEQFQKKQSATIIDRIISFFKSFFGRSHKEVSASTVSTKPEISKRAQKTLSQDTRNIYQKVGAESAPLLALSDFMDITDNGPMDVTKVINEFRDNNLKLVIPIYNARNALYPVKSSRYLIPDVDYLLVDPGTIESMESLNRYIDLITGFKLKDEAIPVTGIIAIEKYLTTLYRQKRKGKKR